MGLNIQSLNLKNEDLQESLLRSLLLLLGSFFSLILLINVFKIQPTLSPTVKAQTIRDSSAAIPSTANNSQQIIPQENNFASSYPIDETANISALPSTSDMNIKSSPLVNSISTKVSRHFSLKDWLLHNGMNVKDFASIMNLPQAFITLHSLQNSHLISLERIQGQPEKLVYQINGGKNLILQKHAGYWTSVSEDGNHVSQITSLKGTVHHSVLAGLVAAGLTHSGFYHLQAIFRDNINIADFPTGTKFEIALMQDKNKHSTIDSIIGAKFITPSHKVYELVQAPFSNEKEKTEFFTPSGASTNKGFLRFPLHFKYISSPFNLHRFHPLLGIIRPHYGVDLAAPYGTQVHASGNGIIKYEGYENGFGNVIKIKHNGTYSSVYGHLEHFAKGLHIGERVKEGQIIGYVGSTGLATGAHLHYEFHVNGRPVNPATVTLPQGISIPKTEHFLFLGYIHRLFHI